VTGDLVGGMEIEIFDNTAWDLTWFRFNPQPPPGFFSQDGIMCGGASGNCASNAFVWPSIAVDGPRIITGAHFFTTNLTAVNNIPPTAIDQQQAVAVRNSSAGPLVPWHDNRDGNANIYFASFQRYTITLATNPANLLVRFDNGAWQPAPATAQFPSGTSHRIEGQSPQAGGPGVRYAFSQWTDASGVNPR